MTMRIVPDGTGYFDVEGWPDGPYRHEPMYVVPAPEDVADSTFEAVKAIYRRVGAEVAANPWRARLSNVQRLLAYTDDTDELETVRGLIREVLAEVRAMLEEVDR